MNRRHRIEGPHRSTLELVAFALLVLSLASSATTSRAELVTTPDPDVGNLACDLYGADGSPLARTGAFYTNFWPNGVVPYAFEDGTGTIIQSVVRTDLQFVIPFDGPELSSVTGFPRAQFRIDDVIRVSGAQSNNAMNMTIVAAVALNGTTWSRLKVTVPIGWSFNAGNETGNAVTVFVNDGVSPPRRAGMELAMAEWEAVANIDFAPRTNQPDYILIENDTVNSVRGDVGHGSGERTLVMSAWTQQGVMIHELGHSLGLKHEHQRPDRNTYVSIDTSIVQVGSVGNFNLDNSITIYPTLTYDFGSIMHYGQNAFLQNGATGPVITVLPPWDTDWQANIGQRNGLSRWDERTMSFMYPLSNWRFLHQQTTAAIRNGQFLTPYDDLARAYALTPTNGRLHITHPGSYVNPGVYSKAMTIEAPQGGVTISHD